MTNQNLLPKLEDLSISFYYIDSHYSIKMSHIKDVFDDPLKWFCQIRKVSADDVLDYLRWENSEERGVVRCNGKRKDGKKCRNFNYIGQVGVKNYINLRDNYYCHLHSEVIK